MKRVFNVLQSAILVLVGLVLAALLVLACASPPEASGTAVEPISESSSPEIGLAEAARAEGGELMVYTSMNIDDLEQILAKFEETYPFVSTEYYRASGGDVIQKALVESQAGQQFADVFETEAFEVYRLQEAGLLQPFVASESEVFPGTAKDPDGFWTIDRIVTVVIGYNTELVDPADVPSSWEDLLDPKWKGLIGVEGDDVELMTNMVNHWGAEKTYAFWEGIASQQPAIVDGHSELAELTAAGEFAISPTLYGHRVEKLKARGAPLEWVKTDPVFAYSVLLAIAADAPHPATAKLFVNWLLSEEGQMAIRDVGRIPARPGINADPPALTAGLNLVYTNPAMAADYNEYAEKWSSILELD